MILLDQNLTHGQRACYAHHSSCRRQSLITGFSMSAVRVYSLLSSTVQFSQSVCKSWSEFCTLHENTIYSKLSATQHVEEYEPTLEDDTLVGFANGNMVVVPNIDQHFFIIVGFQREFRAFLIGVGRTEKKKKKGNLFSRFCDRI